MKNLVTLAFFLLLVGCTRDKPQEITSVLDYEKYLSSNEKPSIDDALKELSFWQSRLTKDSIDLITLNKIAGLHNTLFVLTGEVSNLYTSEKLIKKSLDLSARDKDSYLRSLAHNYITQHRFKEAETLLDSAYTFPDNKRATEFMLFDVSMELGAYRKADGLLGKIKNNSDYNYLIRLSKWSDYKGNLDAAIRYMEQAKTIAKSGGQVSLKVWTYSNIADYYGHAGRLKEAYEHYLMTLELQPDNAYAKKGIAWIIYASEGNTIEANRILDIVSKYHKVPDYFLLKAELAEFDENLSEVKIQKEKFIKAVTITDYGEMYNTYLIDLYAKNNPQKALSLAKLEVVNRATPEAYQLLAYAQLMVGMKEEALITLENYVVGKTFEPKATYIIALVYKANGMLDMLPELKSKLKDAAFELGPVRMREIEDI
jgi:tetratricopeptide (TPR) repeat protein